MFFIVREVPDKAVTELRSITSYKLMNKKFKVLISWIVVFLWMLLIFILSSQVAVESDGLSLGITDRLIGAFGSLSQVNVETINHILRKGAHFSAYLLLAIFCSKASRQSGISGLKGFILVFSLCVIYAISDEIHQLFVEGRSGLPSDVVIDSLGALTGRGIFQFITKLFFKTPNNSTE